MPPNLFPFIGCLKQGCVSVTIYISLCITAMFNEIPLQILWVVQHRMDAGLFKLVHLRRITGSTISVHEMQYMLMTPPQVRQLMACREQPDFYNTACEHFGMQGKLEETKALLASICWRPWEDQHHYQWSAFGRNWQLLILAEHSLTPTRQGKLGQDRPFHLVTSAAVSSAIMC